MTPNIHDIKCEPPYFQDVIDLEKGFEVRKNDRDYREGDYLLLREWLNNAYTGRWAIFRVDYITPLRHFGDDTVGMDIIEHLNPYRRS